MNGTMPVSAIIPVYNGARFLGAAIESVLTQTRAPAEVIVVDDGSTDRTPEVARGFGAAVRYHRQPNAGSSAARNRGVELSTAPFLAFLDADDLWTRERLALQAEAMRRDSRLDIVFGHVLEFHGAQPPDPAAGNPVAGHHPGAALLHRDVFTAMGGFNEESRHAEVVDWMARLLEAGLRYRVIPEVVMLRRLHAGNKGQERADAGRAYLRVLKAHLDRTRRQR